MSSGRLTAAEFTLTLSAPERRSFLASSKERTPAHGEGDEDPFRHPRHHVQEDGPFLVGGGDVQEDELVGPRLVVGPGRLHGVPGVP